MARTTEPAPEESAPLVCPAPELGACLSPDPWAGHGGTYELNLLTGQRKPVTKTEEI
jgi:hypothetical protein